MAEPVLQLRGVAKRFGEGVVLGGVDLSLTAGERRGLIGPNGAGKTTLINTVTGMFPPDAGRILYRGRDITGLPAHRRNRLGIARSFQIISLFGAMTVRENLHNAILRHRGLHVRVAHRRSALREIGAEAAHAAALMGLGAVLDERAAALAYGMQRRLDIALALVQQPDLLILDEPAAGLSGAETRELITLLKAVIGNATLLLVEHDMDVVYGLCGRITVLDYGKVLAEGTPAEINRDPDVRRVYLGEDAA